jgi:hypothetical protein
MTREPHEITQELIAASENADFSARGVLGRIFPGIVAASSRMSTRAISRWLAENHGIKVSDVTVGKALRNPDRHWDEFLDTLEPYAFRIEEATGVGIESFLTDQKVFEHVEDKQAELFCLPTTREEYDADRAELSNNIEALKERWFCLDEAIRSRAYPAIHRRWPSGTNAKEEGAPTESMP